MQTMIKPAHLGRLTGSLMLAALLFTGCYKDKFTDIEVPYRGTLALPVGTVSFSLSDLLAEDSLFTADAQGGVGIVYRQDNFFSLSASDLLHDLTEGLQENFIKDITVGFLSMNDMAETLSLPFSQYVDKFNDPALRAFLQQKDGSMQPIPAFQENIQDEIELPPLADFTYAELESGLLRLTIQNSLFVDLQDFSAELVDNASGQTVGVFEYAYIAKGTAETQELDLQGKTISNDLKVRVSDLNSPGSGGTPVLIDLDAPLAYGLELKNVVVRSGQVAIQPGLLAADALAFDFPLQNDERLAGLYMNGAKVNYTLDSDIGVPVKLKAVFPHIFKNGQPVVQEINVQPNGQSSGSLDFSNTTWKLDQQATQPFNRFEVAVELSVPGTAANQVVFSSDDKVTFRFSLNDVQVAEATGYFGFREEQLEENEIDLGFDLSKFGSESSPLYFSDPKMKIIVDNSFGIPLRADFNVKATGSNGGSALLNPLPVNIKQPSLAEMGQVATTGFVLNKFNSNIVDLLSIYPTSLLFNGTATINPDNDPQALNFITAESALTASLEFDLPFRFQVQDLVYRDTGEALNLDLEAGLTLEDIQKADLKIHYENGLPLATTARILALDANGGETVVVENATIEPAMLGANGKVSPDGIATGELLLSLSREQVGQLDRAVKNIYEIRFQTGGNGQAPINLYTDYNIDLKVGLSLTFDK